MTFKLALFVRRVVSSFHLFSYPWGSHGYVFPFSRSNWECSLIAYQIPEPDTNNDETRMQKQPVGSVSFHVVGFVNFDTGADGVRMRMATRDFRTWKFHVGAKYLEFWIEANWCNRLINCLIWLILRLLINWFVSFKLEFLWWFLKFWTDSTLTNRVYHHDCPAPIPNSKANVISNLYLTTGQMIWVCPKINLWTSKSI